MKRLLILLVLPILACGRLTTESASPTITPLAPLIAAPTTPADSQPEPDSAAAPVKATPIVNASSFPDANAYEWKLIASGLHRPVDIQPANDGSGRLFIIEKLGYIRIYENGQLLDAPFLD
ncbi:hypothetical protein JZU46_03535, partial [bacterium]|nr:hypothetical protein [bacterium]